MDVDAKNSGQNLCGMVAAAADELNSETNSEFYKRSQHNTVVV